MKNILFIGGAVLSCVFYNDATAADIGLAATIVNCTQKTVTGYTENEMGPFDFTLKYPNQSAIGGCIDCLPPPTFSFYAKVDESYVTLGQGDSAPTVYNADNITISTKSINCPAGENNPYTLWVAVFSDNSIPECGTNVGCLSSQDKAKALPKVMGFKEK
ncbi:MAG: hypothetical protein JSR85_02875 [Proteobacteria bacterium]|nr:hypothetical protein [Pseudomonadota bacterium]